MYEKYKNTVVTVKVPAFNSLATFEYLRSMALCGMANIKETTLKNWRPSQYKEASYTFNQYQTKAAYTFVKRINDTFKEGFLTVTVTETNAYADDWELLKDLLATIDWNYGYSDDHRVWANGERIWANIVELIKQLRVIDGERVATIYHLSVPNREISMQDCRLFVSYL